MLVWLGQPPVLARSHCSSRRRQTHGSGHPSHSVERNRGCPVRAVEFVAQAAQVSPVAVSVTMILDGLNLHCRADRIAPLSSKRYRAVAVNSPTRHRWRGEPIESSI